MIKRHLSNNVITCVIRSTDRATEIRLIRSIIQQKAGCIQEFSSIHKRVLSVERYL